MLRICCVYRSGTATSLGFNFPLFLEEFEAYLTSLLEKPGKSIILGDFNVHVEDDNCPNAIKFKSLLSNNGWQQHVSHATHIAGGTLDLILSCTNITDCLDIQNILVTPTTTSSDHYFVTLNCNVSPNSKNTPQPISYRKIDTVHIDLFKRDILNSPLCNTEALLNLTKAVEIYNSELLRILDCHAPVRTMTPKPNSSEWWNRECQEARKMRRSAECQYNRYKTDNAKHNFKAASKRAALLIKQARNTYYKSKIGDCKMTQNELMLWLISY